MITNTVIEILDVYKDYYYFLSQRLSSGTEVELRRRHSCANSNCTQEKMERAGGKTDSAGNRTSELFE